MTEQVRHKVVRIMLLATVLNETPTRQEVTGNKPTVMVGYYGHTNTLCYELHSKGWIEGIPSDKMIMVSLDIPKETKALDNIIAELSMLIDEWGTHSSISMPEWV